MRRWRMGVRARASSAEKWMASSKRTPSGVSVKTPSRTTTWKWKWGLRAEPDPDPEHGAGEGGVVMEEGADPLGDGEHPLTDRQRRQDVVGKMNGDLNHPAGVAGGADTSALAREGYQALGGAVVAADAGEAVGQDAAAEVGSEVVLDPARHALAPGIGLGGTGQERLEVVLDDGGREA